ncbi:MAG: primase-helicase family protein [Candidatus Acidiferrales bacterium]
MTDQPTVTVDASTAGPEPQLDQLRIDCILDNITKEFNEKFFVVEEYGGKCIVAWQEPDPDPQMKGRLRFEIQTFANFINRYIHRKFPVEITRTGTRKDSAGKIWLEHPRRNQYLRVVFAPNMPPREFREAKRDAKIRNLWNGFSVTPKEGDCSLFLAHLRTVICRDHPLLYEYFLNWMAKAAQQPGERGHVALVFKGKKGSGKSLVVEYFGHLFGNHFLELSQGSQVTGNFNSHLRDTCILGVNEAFFAGDPRQVGPLKALITDPMIAIEQKFVDVINVPNTLHFMVTTNEEWSIPATSDERRFCYFEVSDEMVGDMHYFRQIIKERDNGGYAALLDMLLKRDISKFEPRNFPKTEGLRRQMSQSLSPVESAWFECLVSGALPVESPNLGSHVIEELRTLDGTAVMRSAVFIEWAARKNRRWTFGDEKVSNLLRESRRASDSMGFKKEKVQLHGQRRNAWMIPTLVECRRRWNEKRFEHDWKLTPDETWEANVVD